MTSYLLDLGWPADLEGTMMKDTADRGIGKAALSVDASRGTTMGRGEKLEVIHDAYGIAISELAVLEALMKRYNRSHTTERFLDMITAWRTLEDSMDWYVDLVKEFRF